MPVSSFPARKFTHPVPLGLTAAERRHARPKPAQLGLRARLRRLLTPPSTNYLFREIRPAPYQLLPPAALIYDIGSKGAGGCYAFGDPLPDARVV